MKNMSKIIMFKGLPASGKSTKANEICKDYNAVRVNRDLLRDMLHYGVFSGKNEGEVVDSEKTLARMFLLNGKSVVIDDCNLNPSNEDMWRSVATECDAEFEVHIMETAVNVCVERDSKRDKSVGSDIIVNMALQYGLVNIANPVVICDIDGTIADIKHRLHHVKDGKKDWDKFFGAMVDDVVREDVLKMVDNRRSEGKEVIFVSGRPDTYRGITRSWFEKHLPHLADSILLMRGGTDNRPDTDVKRDIFNKYFKDLNVVEVIDDRPSVIRMWRELGLNVTDVGDGIEF